MSELLGSRATTAAEKQRRSRALRALRAKEAAEAELRAYVRAGLVGEDEEALRVLEGSGFELPVPRGAASKNRCLFFGRPL